MAKKTPQDEIKDEPGAEERFMRGIRKALSTPPSYKRGAEAKGGAKAKPTKPRK
jgi:hypothetical protein